ncbi:MAG TPA: PIN domain-containing protein [Thermoanaerobaculia bacterium]|nr:PIN domain-containing protein [Thermoanaerobaculia bacterium]
MILLDTSGVLAALFPDQRRHAECADALLRSVPPRVLSPFVLAELDYLILKFGGVDTELLFLDEVSRGAYEVSPFTAADINEAREVVERYRDLKLGLADASIVVLARRFDSRDLLTLDERHFRAVRPQPRRSFRILPTDA